MTAASRSVQPLPAEEPGTADSFEAQVARWLESNPSFFDTHAELLADIRLRHPQGGNNTVSLVERQVAVLREKNKALESGVAELIGIGQQNDSIGDRLQQLILDLLGAEDRAAIPALLVAGVQSLFDVPQVALRVWDWPDGSEPWGQPVDAETRRRAEAMEGAYCGPRSDWVCAGWLPDGGAQTESMAVLALRRPAADRAEAILRGRRPARSSCLGLLVLGSTDAGRFQAGLGTDLLERLAEVAGAALSRPDQPASQIASPAARAGG